MRITQKDFYGAVERLEAIIGCKLETNIWHKHYSVYTSGKNGSNDKLIVSSNTVRDAYDQIWSAIRALEIKLQQF